MLAFLCNGYEGLLLIFVAAQLGFLVENRAGYIWIVLQAVALTIAVSLRWGTEAALILNIPYLGFQILMFVCVRMFIEERMTRQRLTATHEALLKAQTELAEKSRIEERLRLAQDLHDSLGHNLTALSLNLELAAHTSDGTVRTTIRRALALSRALLLEVKSIVRRSSDDAPVDFVREVHKIAHDLPRPKVHVTCGEDLDFSDPRVPRALLRASQEIVTNAIRHSEAENLWLVIQQAPTCISLVAHDDGKVTTEFVTEGYGLSGMRKRFEELGGSLQASVATTGGFQITAYLPRVAGVLA